MGRADKLSVLESALGHRFSDRSLLVRALSHRSAGATNNERLEFLGDAVLGYVIATRLFEMGSGIREDTMTLMRASMVKGETLAKIARNLEIGSHLRLGVGERKSGADKRVSILADTVEALIGAVHEDGGIDAARQVVLKLFHDRLTDPERLAIKDPKTRLQEYLQGAGLPLPEYSVIATEGADHARLFRVRCRVDSLGLECEGEDRSRRGAEKQAATSMLAEIDERF